MLDETQCFWESIINFKGGNVLYMRTDEEKNSICRFQNTSKAHEGVYSNGANTSKVHFQ